jgi:predicted anti-sigma-YlaC factor YlaD
MSVDLHLQARTLVDRNQMSGISPAEQAWLEDHLRHCDACGDYAELTARAIQGLGLFSFSVDPGLVTRTQEMLARRAREMEAERTRRAMYLRGFALACVFTVLGSALAWQGWAPIAQRIQLVPWAWQLGFLLFWVLPSVTVALLLLIGLALGGSRIHERSLA